MTTRRALPLLLLPLSLLTFACDSEELPDDRASELDDLRSPASDEAPGDRAPSASVTVAEIGEGLDKDIAQRVMKAHIKEAEVCLDSADPVVTIDMDFEIDADGYVAAATPGSNNSESTADCIAERVERWRFPKPKAGATVSVESVFVFVNP